MMDEFEKYCKNKDLNNIIKNIYSDDTKILLKIACKYDDLSIVEYLIDTFDIKLENEKEEAFINACINGHLHIIEYLINKFNITIPPDDECVLTNVCATDYIEVVIYILNKFNIDDTYINEAFIVACEHGQLNIVEYLINNFNADVHYISNFGFELACKNEHFHITDYLIKNFDIDINAYDNSFFMRKCAGDTMPVYICIDCVDRYRYRHCIGVRYKSFKYIMDNFIINIKIMKHCFKYCCKEDCLELVKCIIEKYPSLSDYNILEKIIKSNRIGYEVLKYFLTLYNFEYDDDNNIIIKFIVESYYEYIRDDVNKLIYFLNIYSTVNIHKYLDYDSKYDKVNKLIIEYYFSIKDNYYIDNILTNARNNNNSELENFIINYS